MMNEVYYSEHYDAEQSVEDLCKAARESLIHWYMAHTHAPTWAEGWMGSDDEDYIAHVFVESKGILNNQYFSFDWKDAAYEQMAKNTYDEYYICQECGCIQFNYVCNDCEDEDGDAIDADKMTEKDVEQLIEFLRDCEFEIPPMYIVDALIENGFKAYRDGVEPFTRSTEDELLECVAKIDGADNNQDVLMAAMWALKINHVNGRISEDYGDYVGLDFNLVDQIRSEGIKSVFDSEDVIEFFESDLISFDPLPQHVFRMMKEKEVAYA